MSRTVIVPVEFTSPRAIWPKVNIEVGYNYQCVVRWVANLSQEVIEEESEKHV